jgi:hypothetical protein
MEITQQVRDMAATEAEAGMAAKSAEFVASGGELYREG